MGGREVGADEGGPRRALEQPLDDAQAATSGAGGQAPGVAHVHVVAAQPVGDRTRGRWRTDEDTFGAQDLQHRHQRGVWLARFEQRTAQAVAAWQVVAQELVDATVIDHVRRRVAHRHPVREVRHAVQAAASGVRGIAAAPQTLDVRWKLSEQRP